MIIKWTQDLSVGVEEIDHQHQELFKRINFLLRAMRAGEAGKEAERIILFLGDYVKFHFQTEESYMKRFFYPSFLDHQKQHKVFKRNFSQIEKKYRAKGVTSDLVLRVHHQVVDWWINHIRKVDMTMGDFLKTRI